MPLSQSVDVGSLVGVTQSLWCLVDLCRHTARRQNTEWPDKTGAGLTSKILASYFQSPQHVGPMSVYCWSSVLDQQLTDIGSTSRVCRASTARHAFARYSRVSECGRAVPHLESAEMYNSGLAGRVSFPELNAADWQRRRPSGDISYWFRAAGRPTRRERSDGKGTVSAPVWTPGLKREGRDKRRPCVTAMG